MPRRNLNEIVRSWIRLLVFSSHTLKYLPICHQRDRIGERWLRGLAPLQAGAHTATFFCEVGYCCCVQSSKKTKIWFQFHLIMYLFEVLNLMCGRNLVIWRWYSDALHTIPRVLYTEFWHGLTLVISITSWKLQMSHTCSLMLNPLIQGSWLRCCEGGCSSLWPLCSEYRSPCIQTVPYHWKDE